LREFALELGLPEPPLPWHTDRTRISTIGEALSLLAGVLGKISWDVILMAQTEVGEVAEPAGEGRGSSSTLPHKRNPILSVTAAANARRVRDLARTLGAAMVQEHERAAAPGTRSGRRSPTPSPSPAGPPPTCREATEGLEVRQERMRENLDRTGGMLLAENVTTLATQKLGRLEAHDLVEAACRRALQNGEHLRAELLREGRIREALSEEEIDAALDPAGYLGSAGAFVDRALELYRGRNPLDLRRRPRPELPARRA
jgi:3-carboxy-cis,cis-muconate cycloisomerase